MTEFLLARWLRLWRWVAVFACARLNAHLWDDASTYIVTQTGETLGQKMQKKASNA